MDFIGFSGMPKTEAVRAAHTEQEHTPSGFFRVCI